MSKYAGKAYHPTNNTYEEIFEGFSWPCFLFGCFWYFYKGVWGWGLISFFLAFVTYGISWLIFPFFANEQHAKSLIQKGYLTEKQWKEKNRQKTTNAGSNFSQHQTPLSCADEISKLYELKEKGALTEEEFNKQKQKILS